MSGRIKTWKQVQDVVRGVNHNNVEAVLIIEALLYSSSKEHFVDLMLGAMDAGEEVEMLVSGPDEE